MSNLVTLRRRAENLKDRLAGYATWRVTGECAQCTLPVQIVAAGTHDQCRRMPLVCERCDQIAINNENAAIAAYGVRS
jgi:hypothetical protein